jgi:hypothetical protein
MTRESTEQLLRDSGFHALRQAIGCAGESGTRAFNIDRRFGGGVCEVEGSLTYNLPDGRPISHKSDLLLRLPNAAYIALELKFLSAVSDQFKARAYDMLHLKQRFGGRLLGILVYVHLPGNGVGLEQAKAISYPFERFLGFTLRNPEELAGLLSWPTLVTLVVNELARFGAQEAEA